jgi:poly-beta-1,6-N-acetyl-D-glucosamine synthase
LEFPHHIIPILFAIAYTLMMVRYAIPLYNASRYKAFQPFSKDKFPPVCILVPARNEEQHITACLTGLVQQQYPCEQFEILVIDDQSDDQTVALVQQFIDAQGPLGATSPKLRLLHVPKGSVGGKKQALALGIAETTAPIIMTTDADCTHPSLWLVTMMKYFDEQTGIVAGPVCLQPDKGFLRGFQALDSAGLIGVGAGAFAWNTPHLCNGANLAYRRQAFEDAKGWQHPSQYASGDDMILLQNIRQTGKWKAKFAWSCLAVVQTAPMSNLNALMEQRVRWASKSSAFAAWDHWLLLTVVSTTNLVLLLLYILVGWYSIWDISQVWPWFRLLLVMLGLKTMGDLSVLWPITKMLQNRRLLRYVPLSALVYPLFVSVVGVLRPFSRVYRWKGRYTR